MEGKRKDQKKRNTNIQEKNVLGRGNQKKRKEGGRQLENQRGKWTQL